MVAKIDIRKVSLSEFRKGASIFFPNLSKVLVKDGKIIAKYSAKTRRVTLLKKKRKRK